MFSSYTPRTWQVRAMDAVRAYFTRPHTHDAMVVAGTGSGKTRFALALADEYLARGQRVLWLAAQQELIDQPFAALRETWPHNDGGIIQAERNEVRAQIVFASKATLARPGRLEAYLAHGAPRFVVVDECHESTSAVYDRLLERIREGKPDIMGLTATPEDVKGKLAQYWEIVFTYPLLEAISDGVVVPLYQSYFPIPDLDLDRVAAGRGDWLSDDLERELMRAHVVEHTVSALRRTHLGLSIPFGDSSIRVDPKGCGGGVLVHTVTVDQARATADALNADGWTARVVWAEMPRRDRRRILAAYGNGINVLCSPAALAQGVDLPFGTINTIARPTRSRRLYVQMAGRVGRPYQGKGFGFLLDLVGATKMHSLVSAPILVNIDGCPESETGKHVYFEDGVGGAVCSECGYGIRCLKAMGPHLFKAGKCRHCGAPQCPEAPDKHHHLIPFGAGVRRCMYCPLEVRDRLFSLTKHSYSPEHVNWIPLPEVHPGLYGVHLGRVGSMFKLQQGGLWTAFWVHREGRKRLTEEGVTGDLITLLTDDVARQAAKVRGKYGGGKTSVAERYLAGALVVQGRQLVEGL